MKRKMNLFHLFVPVYRSSNTWICICIILCAVNMVQGQNIRINADFPGGNIQVDSIRDHNVYLQPDLRDTESPWFYWYFSVTAESEDSIRFVFTSPNCMTVKGPAVSKDRGQTWTWLFDQRRSANEFTYLIKAGEEVRFSMGMPYTQQDFEEFILSYKNHSSVKLETLCVTRGGRDVEKLVIRPVNPDNIKQKILLTARHHACEMMANYTLEGIIAAILSEELAMKEFRETTEFWIIPFMDKDGVENGDQGKNRAPRDHNRDYHGKSIYCSTATLREQVPKWSDDKLQAAIDLHCPWIKGDFNEHIYMVGTENPDIAKSQYAFLNYISDNNQGPLKYDLEKGLLPFGTAWNTAKNYQQGRSFSSWASSIKGIDLATTFEIPYSVHNEIDMTVENLRLFGRDLAFALFSYLQK